MESPKKGPCVDSRMDTTAHGRSMHTMVEAGQRLVIFGGVHECGALHDVLFLENAAGKKFPISNTSNCSFLRDMANDEREEN